MSGCLVDTVYEKFRKELSAKNTYIIFIVIVIVVIVIIVIVRQAQYIFEVYVYGPKNSCSGLNKVY